MKNENKPPINQIIGNKGYVNNNLTDNGSNMNRNQPPKAKKSKGTKVLVIIMILVIIASIAVAGVYLHSKYAKDSEKTSSKSNTETKENPKTVSAGGTKTIMIYMCGADLESESKIATLNLKDLMKSDTDYDNINIVLCAGGSKTWHTSEISASETSIYEIGEDGITKVKKQSKQDMGNCKTVTGFLDYVYDNYETDEYYLMFWNHGNALYGIEADELTGNTLSLSDLNKSLNDSKFNKDKIKFDLIILNNCLMGTIETANLLSNYADYLVASEDVMYGDRTIKTFEFLDGISVKDNAIDIGKNFVDSYVNSFSRRDEVTMALIDLSKVDDIIDNLDDYIEGIDLTEKSYKKIARIRYNNVHEYQKDSDVYDMVDLYELVEELESLNDDNSKLLKSINNAVIYNGSTDNHSNGLSIYFPESYDWTDVYKDLKISSSYGDFVEELVDLYTGKANFKISLNNKEFNKTSEGFTLQLTEEEASIYKNSEFMIFEKNNDETFDGTYTVSLISPYTNIDENGLITADLVNQTIALVDENDEPILRLANLIELDRTDEYVKYALPVALESQFDEDDPYQIMGQMSLAMAIVKAYNDDSVEVVKYINWSTDENGRASTNGAIIDIYSGEYRSIKFLNHAREINVDENGNYVGVSLAKGIYGEEFHIEDEFKFKKVELDPEKEYVGVLSVEDVYGDKYYSKVIDVEIK